jgi:hypothetical protein
MRRTLALSVVLAAASFMIGCGGEGSTTQSNGNGNAAHSNANGNAAHSNANTSGAAPAGSPAREGVIDTNANVKANAKRQQRV